MDTPRLHNHPIDPEIVAQIRANQRARQASRLARRSSPGRPVAPRGVLQWLSS